MTACGITIIGSLSSVNGCKRKERCLEKMLKTKSNYHWLVSFNLFTGHQSHVRICFSLTSSRLQPRLRYLTARWIYCPTEQRDLHLNNVLGDKIAFYFTSLLDKYAVCQALLSEVTFSYGRPDPHLHCCWPTSLLFTLRPEYKPSQQFSSLQFGLS